MGNILLNSGHPGELSQMGSRFCDQGSVRLFPMMIALTPSSVINFSIWDLKSEEYSFTDMPYLQEARLVSMNDDAETYCFSMAF